MSSAGARRPRHDPKDSEREILEAAERLMRERPFREVTVDALMRQTGLKRTAFYVHFRDREDLVLRITQLIGAELFDMTDRWLQGDQPEEDLRSALNGVAAVFVNHGPVLRAVADAATSDAAVETVYRALVQSFVDATARHIREEQAAGRTPADLDPDHTAGALIWLNERFLSETLGRYPQGDQAQLVETLYRIWYATLYAPSA
jgi:AcrR family transcriptional regulator